MADYLSRTKALNSLYPEAQWNWEEGKEIEWISNEPNPAPTMEQIDAEAARIAAQIPFNNCKERAKQLIAACDWSALPDVGLVNQADFIAYRAALRALIINPVADPVWPTEPTPEWG